ncbi:serine hydrolase domain-containing protein [Dactylosporangium salmoneum]
MDPRLRRLRRHPGLAVVALTSAIEALTRRAPMPAVAVSVFDRAQVRAAVVHGTADVTTGRPATADSWWDLASLTKVLVTLPEVQALAVPLDRPLRQLWPRAAGTPAGGVTAEDLLAHRSGLPASRHFFRTLHGRDAIVDAALATPLTEAGPVYSDLGYIILGALVEDLTGSSLAALAARRTGLRMGGTVSPAVATEECPWRGRLIAGEVHDENAAAMGGVSGHAGAFGTLELVTEAARAWLGDAPPPCLAANDEGERFAAGWWLHPTRGLGGPAAGPDGYGASGFVGNRVWFEPSRGYGVVVLSNRVHPVRVDRAPYNAWCDELLQLIASA